ncbi:hypothetical protein CJP16_15875 [Aeromonas sobria]|uniref:Uncharacterized protein n=1 Tax=Aeromonas sobria TaxID=646 RepID=A0A2N3IST0_AERSO|nr:hypothetical protein CJP16_15875 [Aeromonas sobria]
MTRRAFGWPQGEGAQWKPLYPGFIWPKISRRRDKGLIKGQKRGGRISRFYQDGGVARRQLAVFKWFLAKVMRLRKKLAHIFIR